MRTAAQWLDDYGDSHRKRANKVLHWICVPVIAWCVLGLLWSLPFPVAVRAMYPAVNWASVAVLAALGYYAVLSPRLALGALPLLLAFLWSIDPSNAGVRRPCGASAWSCSWRRGSANSSAMPSRVSVLPSSRTCSS